MRETANQVREMLNKFKIKDNFHFCFNIKKKQNNPTPKSAIEIVQDRVLFPDTSGVIPKNTSALLSCALFIPGTKISECS